MTEEKIPEEKTPEGRLLELIRRKGKKPGDAGGAPDSGQSPRNRLLQGLKVLRGGPNDPPLRFSLSRLNLFKGPKKAVKVDFDLVNKIIVGVIAVFFVMLLLQIVFPYPRKEKTVIEAPAVVRKRVPAKSILRKKEEPFDFEKRDIFRPYDARQVAAGTKDVGGTISGLTLIGIVYGDDPQAVIREGKKGPAGRRIPSRRPRGFVPEGPRREDKVVREGEMIGDVKVIEIKRREVVLEYRGEHYTLSL